MHTAKRLEWVDIAKGLSIILVVMMYTTNGVGEETGATNFMHWIVAFAKPLRMPEFFLISGLFLSYGITRTWRQFADKRFVHYIYFYVLWSIILYMFKIAIFDGNPLAALQNILMIGLQPYSVLWFVYALALFSLAIKALHSLRVPHWAALAVGIILQMLPINTASYFVNDLAEYFVYYYAGYAFAPHILQLVAFTGKKTLLALTILVAWVLINGALVFNGDFSMTVNQVQMGYASLPGLHLALAFAGALAVCILAGQLAESSLFNWLRYLGSKSLIVYLSFLIPMAATREILLRLNLVPDAGIVSLIVLIVATASPLVVFAIIEKTGWGRFLFTRPSWAQLSPSKDEPHANISVQHPATR